MRCVCVWTKFLFLLQLCEGTWLNRRSLEQVTESEVCDFVFGSLPEPCSWTLDHHGKRLEFCGVIQSGDGNQRAILVSLVKQTTRDRLKHLLVT